MKNKLLSVVVAVVFLLGGAGVVILADRQGWLPGSTDRSGGSQAAGCPHELTRDTCPFCSPNLIEEMGQCVGHGVPEALCHLCNPALIPAFKAVGDWCAGHNVPESQCLICNPGLRTASIPGIGKSDLAGDIRLTSVTEVARNQRAPSVTCQTETLRVQFLNPTIAERVGLEYARIERREVAATLSCNVEIEYDGNRYARLSPRAAGVVLEVRKDLGKAVKAGETLAIVDSAELGTAKSAHLQARALLKLWTENHAREQRLFERKISPESDLLKAEASLAESRIAVSRTAQRLRNLGLTDADIASIEQNNDSSSLLPLGAPFSGVVVERNAVIGELADTATRLFAVADTATMWAMLDVYEKDIGNVRPGQPVVLSMDGAGGEKFGGKVTWVSSHVDPRTRTLKVRAEIANPEGFLRDGMFGTAEIRLHDQAPVLVVPKDAVQWDGCCNIVFVQMNDSLFRPKKVRLGYETDRHFVVRKGLERGERVVTTGSFLLKTEIMKGSIGAGCCEVEPGKQRES